MQRAEPRQKPLHPLVSPPSADCYVLNLLPVVPGTDLNLIMSVEVGSFPKQVQYTLKRAASCGALQ